jgi:hypothetical protein
LALLTGLIDPYRSAAEVGTVLGGVAKVSDDECLRAGGLDRSIPIVIDG